MVAWQTEQDSELAGVSARLSAEFAGVFSRETVERCVLDSRSRLLAAAQVPYFVPLLMERFARERLRAAAQVKGMMSKELPEVLFVCVHNAGRSQMAAALTDVLSEGRVRVRSAGSAPAELINPAVAEVLAEMGIDISREYPKPLTDEVVEASDVVITMGCGDACPIYPGKRYLDWVVDDPAGQPLDTVRRIREEIRGRVEGLLRELAVPVAPR